MIEIITYQDEHGPVFRAINQKWLEEYGLLEEVDIVMLNDPRGSIIDAGGVIYIAWAEGMVVGSAALIKEHEGVYELAKMGVADEWRGKGISKMLLERCIEKAREFGAEKVVLFSNDQLTRALGLYRQYGFKDVAVTDSPFSTANVKMELVL